MCTGWPALFLTQPVGVWGVLRGRDRSALRAGQASLRMVATWRHLEWWSAVLKLLLERGVRLEVALQASWDQVRPCGKDTDII